MKKAFTLVELIVVVIIIGILAAVGIPQYTKALERSRGAEAYAGLGHIQEAEKLYYADDQAYTDNLDLLDITLPRIGWTFAVTGVTTTDFTATATRRAGQGPCSAAANNTIAINASGSKTSATWETCVGNL